MQLGKYEIIEELGRGGFGIVYKAHDTVLNVDRALKVLHPALVTDETFLERFKHEAQYAARLEHPNLVPVYDFAEAEGRYFLAMKYMPGKSLKDLLKEKGKLEEKEALRIFEQVCAGVAYAHQQGVIHRDLKPGNILMDEDGSVRVSDMGFAKAIAGSSSVTLSATGSMIGTPSYMAPEIWRGKSATPASDQYSLACILYEMLTGKVLFDGESPADIITRHVVDGPQFAVDLSGNMRTTLQKALVKDPDQRFETLPAFSKALIVAPQPQQAPKISTGESKSTKGETKSEKIWPESQFITTSCPSCGQSIRFGTQVQKFACPYCGKKHEVIRENGIHHLQPILENVNTAKKAPEQTPRQPQPKPNPTVKTSTIKDNINGTKKESTVYSGPQNTQKILEEINDLKKERKKNRKGTFWWALISGGTATLFISGSIFGGFEGLGLGNVFIVIIAGIFSITSFFISLFGGIKEERESNKKIKEKQQELNHKR